MSSFARPWEGARLVLDLGGTCIRSGRVDEEGRLELSSQQSEKIAASLASRGDLRDVIVEKIVQGGGGQDHYVLSVAGPVSSDCRVVRKYTNVLPDDSEIPLADMVEEAVRARTSRAVLCTVIKDAVASTMAEMGPRGAAADRDEVLALILGTGTGGAPCRRLSDGRIVPMEALADLGHYQVDPRNTEPCNCGSRGCVEQQTSGSAVVRSANRRAQEDSRYAGSSLAAVLKRKPGEITGEDLAGAAIQRDPFVMDVLQEAARPLALLLKCVFTSHPGMTVVLVGGLAFGVGAVLRELAGEALRESGIPFIDRKELAAFVRSRILVGAVPPEETNLVGARSYLHQLELESRAETVGLPTAID